MQTEVTTPTIYVGRVWGSAFTTYASNFPKFFLVSLIAQIPVMIFFFLMLNGDIAFETRVIVFAAVAELVLESMVTLVLCRAAWDARRGRKVSLRACWKAAAPRFLAGLGTSITSSVLVALGFVLLIVPGIMLLVATWVAIPVCLIEGLGPFASLSRSSTLLRGHGWKIFGIVVLFSALDKVPDKFIEKMLEQGGMTLETYFVILVALAVLLAPLRAMLVAMSYIDARAIHADKDIEAVASIFGESPNADQPPVDARTPTR